MERAALMKDGKPVEAQASVETSNSSATSSAKSSNASSRAVNTGSM